MAQAADLMWVLTSFLWVLTSFDAFDLLDSGRGLTADRAAGILADAAERSMCR